jgi:8-oxo-dGTP diphosphatase
MAGMFVVNIEVAVRHEDRWLLVERSAKEAHAGGALAMPGGTVEYSDAEVDTFEGCARREVLEEVGVTLGPDLRYVESKRFYSARGRWVLNVVFLGRYQSGAVAARDPDEASWAGWLSWPEVLADPRSPQWLKASLTAAQRCLTGSEQALTGSGEV